MTMQYKLTNGLITLSAESKGAETVSLLYRGKERLWMNDTGEWSGRAPVLFPVCGNCAVTVGGKDYPVAKHGFAKVSDFCVDERGEHFISFSMRSDAETKKQFPYDFKFTVVYRLCGNSAEITYITENTGEELLYFSCGGHESFALDETIENYEVRFEREEKLIALAHDGDGKLTGGKKLLSVNGVLPLKGEYFTRGNTLIFGNLESRKATLYKKGGGAVAATSFDGFGNFLLWKPERAKMLCMEPWLNLPDTAGDKREFSDKAGVVCVQPKESRKFVRVITYYNVT